MPDRSTHPSLPSIGTTPRERRGIAVVESTAARTPDQGGPGCLFREQHVGDVGIDGHLEILDPPGLTATGRIVGVQVKAGPSYFAHPTADPDGWTVYIKHATVHYWRAYAVPVVLVLVDLDTGAAYWRRVDVGEFPQTEEFYKILVPRAQQFDARARTALAAVAARPPEDLGASLARPPEAVGLEQAARARAAAAATPEDWRAVAELRSPLGRVLREAEYPYAAAFAWRSVVSACIQAGDRARADSALADFLEWGLAALRDADFLGTLYADARVPERLGLTAPVTVPASAVDELRVEVAAAEIDALAGDATTAAALAPRLDALGQATDPPSAGALRRSAAWLRALGAVAAEDHAGAAVAYAALAAEPDRADPAAPAAPATSPASHPDPAQQQAPGGEHHARLRALLHRGLAGDATAVDTARGLIVPPEYEGDRGFVVAWLAAAAGRYDDARRAATAAADASLALNDTRAAARAYRVAEWTDRCSPQWDADAAESGRMAARLEHEAARRTPSRATPVGLVARADAALARGDARAAYVAAHAARVLAWEEADVAAYEDARMRLAVAWRAAAREWASPEVLHDALTETARTRAVLADPDAPELQAFTRRVRDRVLPAHAAAAWTALLRGREAPEHPAPTLTGALRLACDLADVWVSDDWNGRDAAVADLVCAGLAQGWQRSTPLNAAHPACALVIAMKPPLAGDAAARVRNALCAAIPTATPGDLDTALNALGAATRYGTPPTDEGRAVEHTLAAVEAVGDQVAGPQWAGALAALWHVATGETRARVEQRVRERVGRRGASPAGWWDLERALWAGFVFRPEEARAYADAHFTAVADALDEMRREAGSGSLGGGRRAVHALGAWAADHATPAVVQRVVASATAFVGTDGHLLRERIAWVPFLVRLARRDPTWAVAAAGVLRAGARGEWQPVGGFDAFTHPLSSYRVVGFTPERVRGQALAWLAALLPALPASEHAGILVDLTAATRDGAPEVRERVAEGAGWAAHHGDERLRAALTQHVLTPLCHDRAAAVALAAYRALHGERKDERAADAAGAGRSAANVGTADPEPDAAPPDESSGMPGINPGATTA